MFSIVQAFATVTLGVIIGLIYIWKVGLVELGVSARTHQRGMTIDTDCLVVCVPFILFTGYVRFVGCPCLCSVLENAHSDCFQRIVAPKDQRNKNAHEESAQLACEAAGAIRTVASLTCEGHCLEVYSKTLEKPLRELNRTSLWSNLLFSLSRSFSFFIIALTSWYGSRLVSYREFTSKELFTCLMVRWNWNHGWRQLTNLKSTIFGAMQAGNALAFVPDMSLAQRAASDIIHLLDARPEVDAESTEGKILQNVKGEIRLEDVHFCYPTRPSVRVLRGLSISVEPGTYIALVGASGCGKSTM